MYAFLLVLHLIICIMLVAVVLVQSGKGGGLAGGAFSGSAQTVFGGRGATDFFTRATMVLGAAFFISSMVLALLTTGNPAGSRSLIQSEARTRASSTQQGGQPGAPGAPAPGGATAPAGGLAPPSGTPTPTPATGTAPTSPAPQQPAPAAGGKK